MWSFFEKVFSISIKTCQYMECYKNLEYLIAYIFKNLATAGCFSIGQGQ